MHILDGIHSGSTITNVLHVASGTATYSARGLTKGSATNVLNDANLPAAYTDDVLSAESGDSVQVGTKTIEAVSSTIYNVHATDDTVPLQFVVPSGADVDDIVSEILVNSAQKYALTKAGIARFSRAYRDIGTAFVAGDYTLSSTWGSTAALTIANGISPTDMGGTLRIASSGAHRRATTKAFIFSRTNPFG